MLTFVFIIFVAILSQRFIQLFHFRFCYLLRLVQLLLRVEIMVKALPVGKTDILVKEIGIDQIGNEKHLSLLPDNVEIHFIFTTLFLVNLSSVTISACFIFLSHTDKALSFSSETVCATLHFLEQERQRDKSIKAKAIFSLFSRIKVFICRF